MNSTSLLTEDQAEIHAQNARTYAAMAGEYCEESSHSAKQAQKTVRQLDLPGFLVLTIGVNLGLVCLLLAFVVPPVVGRLVQEKLDQIQPQQHRGGVL